MRHKVRYKQRRQKRVLEVHVLVGAAFAVVALVVGLVLYSFDCHDPSWFYYTTEQRPIHNFLGIAGSYVSALLLYLLGNASYLLVPLLCSLAWVVWTQKSLKYEWDRFVAAVVAIPVIGALLYSHRIGSIGYMVPGGLLGQETFHFFRLYFDPLVIKLLFWSMLFTAFILISRLSFLVIFEKLFQTVRAVCVNWRQWALPVIRGVQWGAHAIMVPLKWVALQVVRTVQGADVTESEESIFSFEQGEQPETLEQELFWYNAIDRNEAGSIGRVPSIRRETPSLNKTEQRGTASQARALQRNKQAAVNKYSAPSPTLFDPAQKRSSDVRTSQHKQLTQTLEEKLERFGVSGSVTSVKPGPVITLFEYQPDIDAKISKILGLEHDLALALEAMSVRIIAPIPGTSRVGFEVANKEREAVYLRDSIRSSAFQKSRFALPIVLGKDTAGDEVVVDLVDMPHLLVAGSTGSGKSVALNTLLVSLLCKLTPDQLKLIIIDPKRLEFASYQDVAHLLFPIITQPHKAAPVLRWLVKVMEERYEMMAQLGARSISDYKKMCASEEKPDELPYIVLMIDELADLMMVARKEIEESVARLAQMARAAGIHLIVATQRPSVDVLTGVIKVNFPSRISFRVTSKVDSRTVLDALGAETLLGKGDMLFIDAHSARMRRIHGAYVNDAEIDRVVSHIKAQQKVEYTSLEEAVAAYAQEAQQEDEPLLQEISAYLETIDEISISSLQRRFKIGYNRSARIIELLESQGRIMPSTGGKMRKVIH